MDNEIESIFAIELSFYKDLLADVEAGKIMSYATLAARDADGNEALTVWLPDGKLAIAGGTRFAESDCPECGRLEVHDPDYDNPLDFAAL